MLTVTNNVYYFWQPKAGLSPHAYANAQEKYIQTRQKLQMLLIISYSVWYKSVFETTRARTVGYLFLDRNRPVNPSSRCAGNRQWRMCDCETIDICETNCLTVYYTDYLHLSFWLPIVPPYLYVSPAWVTQCRLFLSVVHHDRAVQHRMNRSIEMPFGVYCL